MCCTVLKNTIALLLQSDNYGRKGLHSAFFPSFGRHLSKKFWHGVHLYFSLVFQLLVL